MRQKNMAQADLRRCQKAATLLEEVRVELRAAILAARASGETLRDIAEATNLSHQRIHQIIEEEERQ